MITRYVQYKSKEIMVAFFKIFLKSSVRPVLEYGNVWAPTEFKKKYNSMCRKNILPDVLLA